MPSTIQLVCTRIATWYQANESTPRNHLRLFTRRQVATFPKGKEEKYGGLVCCRLTPSCGGTLYVIVVVGTGGFRGSRSVVSEFSPTLLESSLKVRFLV